MTHLNRFLILLLATSLLIGCAKIKVVKIPEQAYPPPSAHGVIYALPNTVVRVLVKVEKVERSGARYAMFAAIFAPGKKPVCKDEDCTEENKKKFSLKDGASFATYGEPDPANVFLVKFTGGGTIDQKLSMTWNEAGLLSAASAEVTNRTMDVALSGLKLVAGLGTKAFLGASGASATDPCPKRPSNNDVWIKQILQNNGGALAPPLMANYCRIPQEDREKFVNTKANRELLAEATKEYVTRFGQYLRTRDDILTGNYKNQEPISLLNRIEAEIDKELITLYIGVQDTQAWDGVLDVRTITEGTPLTVLRIDNAKGIYIPVNAELAPDSKPVPGEFLLLAGEGHNADPIDLILRLYPDGNKQLFTKVKDDPTGERSFRYRIPAQVRATLVGKSKTYGSGTFSVAQLGTIISLPATRQSKNLSYDLAFIEATGALKTFKLGTAGGLDASTIDALAGVGGTLLDARSAARKSADELTVLTREYTLLKLRDDICTIQKKYGLPCTVEP